MFAKSICAIVPVLVFSLFVLAQGARAGDPPTHPMLRIDIGLHHQSVNSIVTDADEKIFVTASADKTLKVWSAETGDLIRTLRLPIGSGAEGEAYSVAVSPNGDTLAAAGWTGSWDGSYAMYIFETATGSMVRRLTGLPHRVVNLAFSKDGAYVAAVMKGGQGLRVYRTSDWQLAAEDSDYEDDAVWSDFAPDGRLVTTSLDGRIRLYDASFKRIAITEGRAGKSPFGTQFSPDGDEIAVGYIDGPWVEILSGTDLTHLHLPETRGADNGFLHLVAWSNDGAVLYAGGSYERRGRVPIRRWADKGRGRFKDLAVATNVIMKILPLKTGNIAFAANDPSFGVMESSGRKIYERRPDTGDFRGLAENFLVSADGTVAEFSFEAWGERPARFSLAERRLDSDPPEPADDLRPPRLEAPGLRIEDWQNALRDWGVRTHPTLNGERLPLLPHENSLSLAIAPDGKSFLLGTHWRLIRFDDQGRELWSIRRPTSVSAVNIAEDGRIVVTAEDDGAIHWYRMEDGQELLTFFARKDSGRWVAWTPSGYYMSSVDGDSLIGWHVNRGTDETADFFSVARFRDHYYRPDVLERLFQTLDEGKAIRRADAAAGRREGARDVAQILPPVATIVSPTDGVVTTDTKVELVLEVRSPSGEPVTSVEVRVDGRPVGGIYGDYDVGRGGSTINFTALVPKRDAVIEVIAQNRFEIASEPAAVRILWGGKPMEFRPTLYVLAVGVSQYRDPDLALGFAAKDARDFVAIMMAQKGHAYKDVEVRLLTDEEANLMRLRRDLEWIANAPGKDDVAMIFLAGHGVDDVAGHYFFVPYDGNPEAFTATSLPYADLKRALSRIRGRTVFFVDTCKSGGVWGRPGEPSMDVTRVVNDLKSPENGVVVFASSTARQLSIENEAWANGAFTKAVVEGLAGAADLLRNRKVTVTTLDAYVANRVAEMTQGRQTPATGKPVSADFNLVILPRGAS